MNLQWLANARAAACGQSKVATPFRWYSLFTRSARHYTLQALVETTITPQQVFVSCPCLQWQVVVPRGPYFGDLLRQIERRLALEIGSEEILFVQRLPASLDTISSAALFGCERVVQTKESRVAGTNLYEPTRVYNN